MNSVRIIIVTYNSTQWLDKVFSTLSKEGFLSQVIVVDNNSTDGTSDLIEEKWPEVHLHRSKENLGFGAGNNLGISIALKTDADYVFLLNHDAWPVRGSIQAAFDALLENPSLGIVSPLHVQADGQTPDQLFARYLTQSQTTFENVVEQQQVIQVSFVNAAAWIIPRRTFEIVGGFSPLFYHYGEDRDYVERLRYHNLKLAVVPDYTIIHDRGSRLEGWQSAPERQMRAFEIGLHQRLSNPNGSMLDRITNASFWWLGNIKTALGVSYWSVLPAAIKMLRKVIVQHHKREILRKEVRMPGPHFIAP